MSSDACRSSPSPLSSGAPPTDLRASRNSRNEKWCAPSSLPFLQRRFPVSCCCEVNRSCEKRHSSPYLHPVWLKKYRQAPTEADDRSSDMSMLLPALGVCNARFSLPRAFHVCYNVSRPSTCAARHRCAAADQERRVELGHTVFAGFCLCWFCLYAQKALHSGSIHIHILARRFGTKESQETHRDCAARSNNPRITFRISPNASPAGAYSGHRAWALHGGLICDRREPAAHPLR